LYKINLLIVLLLTMTHPRASPPQGPGLETKEGVAKCFATPSSHFACGKMVACGQVYPLAIARSTQKGPQGRPFSHFSRQVFSALIQIYCFATAPAIYLDCISRI
jgi:hypothetical protein